MEEKKAKPRRRKYDAEFRAEVVKMVLNGRPKREVAEHLGIGANLICQWKKRSQANPNLKNEASTDGPSVSFAEHQALQAKLVETERKRDILKKL